jgi:hypothetical protein
MAATLLSRRPEAACVVRTRVVKAVGRRGRRRLGRRRRLRALLGGGRAATPAATSAGSAASLSGERGVGGGRSGRGAAATATGCSHDSEAQDQAQGHGCPSAGTAREIAHTAPPGLLDASVPRQSCMRSIDTISRGGRAVRGGGHQLAIRNSIAESRALSSATVSRARIERSAWSRTRSIRRTRSGSRAHSCFSRPNSRSTAPRWWYSARNRLVPRGTSGWSRSALTHTDAGWHFGLASFASPS